VRAGHVTVAIELKAQRLTNAAAARQAVAYARALPPDAHLVLVAQSITEDARDQLTRAGIGFIDGTGTIRLDLPGLYIWRDGQRQDAPTRKQSQPVALSGKAGVAAQTLLREPGRPWTVHDLAEAANVSVGLVH